MDQLSPLEPSSQSPLCELLEGIVKSSIRLKQHVQTHLQTVHILSSIVIDHVLNSDEGASFVQCLEGGLEQMIFLILPPIMQNVSHCYHICFREVFLEEVYYACGNLNRKKIT